MLIVVLALAGSLVYPRFWCRYLCPTGAFLSLLNGVAILKRYLPAKKFSRCEFGVTARDQMDCIQCDRCRYEPRAGARREAELAAAQPSTRPVARLLTISVLTVSLLVLVLPVHRLVLLSPSALDWLTTAAASGGQPRDVDLQGVRTMIEQRQLSDHEAEYYKRVD